MEQPTTEAGERMTFDKYLGAQDPEVQEEVRRRVDERIREAEQLTHNRQRIVSAIAGFASAPPAA